MTEIRADLEREAVGGRQFLRVGAGQFCRLRGASGRRERLQRVAGLPNSHPAKKHVRIVEAEQRLDDDDDDDEVQLVHDLPPQSLNYLYSRICVPVVPLQ